MNGRYLVVTFRNGKPWAAYLYLPRRAGVKSARTRKLTKGMIVDLSAEGEIIGLEITAPTIIGVADVNEVLAGYGQPGISSEELAPLAA
jgi:hypothetical protein